MAPSRERLFCFRREEELGYEVLMQVIGGNFTLICGNWITDFENRFSYFRTRNFEFGPLLGAERKLFYNHRHESSNIIVPWVKFINSKEFMEREAGEHGLKWLRLGLLLSDLATPVDKPVRWQVYRAALCFPEVESL